MPDKTLMDYRSFYSNRFYAIFKRLPPTRQEEREPETHNGNPPEPLSFIPQTGEGGR